MSWSRVWICLSILDFKFSGGSAMKIRLLPWTDIEARFSLFSSSSRSYAVVLLIPAHSASCAAVPLPWVSSAVYSIAFLLLNPSSINSLYSMVLPLFGRAGCADCRFLSTAILLY